MPSTSSRKNQKNIKVDLNATLKNHEAGHIGESSDDEFPLTSGLQVLDDVLVTAKKGRSTSQSRRRNRALDNNGDLFTLNADNVIPKDEKVTSSGGENRSENDETRSGSLANSLYGTNRFNKLWDLYNDVKGQKDIESNPKYQRLLNKLVRKMPKTLRNLEKNVDKTERKRQEMSTKLGFEPTVSSKSQIVSNARDTVEKFLNNPTPEHVPADTNISNPSTDDITGVGIVGQKYSAGENLGSRLGTDISAALKNKKW
jgi:hypothetical protein